MVLSDMVDAMPETREGGLSDGRERQVMLGKRREKSGGVYITCMTGMRVSRGLKDKWNRSSAKISRASFKCTESSMVCLAFCYSVNASQLMENLASNRQRDVSTDHRIGMQSSSFSSS
jgi:hypothetical protein